MFGGSFAPSNWALCNGQMMQISQSEVLFTLIGTTYGGDGVQTFALPDLRGRFPVDQGNGGGQTVVMGQSAGTEMVTLTPGQLPSSHTHQPYGSSAASSQSPQNSAPAEWTGEQYSTATPTGALLPAAVSVVGGSAPHENRSPYLAVNFIIALFGVYPSQG